MAVTALTPELSAAQQVLQQVKSFSAEIFTIVDDNFLMNCPREHTIADLVKSHGVRKRFSLEYRTDSVVRHPELIENWVDIGLYAVLLG